MAKLERSDDRERAQSADDQVAALRSEIAGALGTAEDDPVVDQVYAELAWSQRETMDAERVARNQQSFDDALEFGRRLEENIKLGDQTLTRFTEYIPGSAGIADALVRTGIEISEPDMFGNVVTTRTTSYFDPHGAVGDKLGTVTSVIEGGRETVTEVREEVLGSIELKPGDNRPAAPGGASAAGTKPTSWDPKSDGTYGTAAGGGATHSSGAPTSDTSSSDHDTPAHHGGPAAGGGGEQLHERPAPADDGGSPSTGDTTSSFTREQGGEQTASGTTTKHSDGSVTVSTSSNAASGSVTYQSEKERAETEVTQEPGTVSVEGDTTVEVEKPATTDDDTTEYRSDDGYSDLGPQPEPERGVTVRTTNETTASHARISASGTAGGTPISGEQSNETNITGAPIDFGDSADPFRPDPIGVGAPEVPGTATLDLVDGDAIFTSSTGTIRPVFGGDFGDPADPFATDAPQPGDPNDTSPYEHDDNLLG
jgi:hypothetical protein